MSLKRSTKERKQAISNNYVVSLHKHLRKVDCNDKIGMKSMTNNDISYLVKLPKGNIKRYNIMYVQLLRNSLKKKALILNKFPIQLQEKALLKSS